MSTSRFCAEAIVLLSDRIAINLDAVIVGETCHEPLTSCLAGGAWTAIFPYALRRLFYELVFSLTETCKALQCSGNIPFHS